ASFQVSSSGTVALSGGTLTALGSEYVGFSGFGNFAQSGGTNTVPSLYVGFNANGTNASGTYSLSNGATLKVTDAEYIGYSGNGTFTQTGGSHAIGDIGISDVGLYMGLGQNSSGVYN